MKKIITGVACLVVLSCLSGCVKNRNTFEPRSESVLEQPVEKIIAEIKPMDFNGFDKDSLSKLYDKIGSALNKNPYFTIVDKSILNKVMEENQFQTGDWSAEQKTVTLPNITVMIFVKAMSEKKVSVEFMDINTFETKVVTINEGQENSLSSYKLK